MAKADTTKGIEYILPWSKSNEDSNTEISAYTTVYRNKETHYIAYYIRNKSDIMIPESTATHDDFVGVYQHLKNNFGIYFLIGENAEGKKTVYVGQASTREEPVGMDRLKEHIRHPDSYYDKWKSAIYVTRDDNKFGTGEIDTLERLFIAVFKANKNFESLNNMPGKDGNIPEENFRTALVLTGSLLSRNEFGYNIMDGLYAKAGDADAALAEYLFELAEQAKSEVAAERLSKYSDEDLQAISWYKAVKKYQDFRDKLTEVHNYVFNDRVLSGSKKPEVMTPLEVAKSMVAEIPSEQFTSKSTFLDLYCKSGSFFIALIDRFMSDDPNLPINSEPEYADRRKRLNHLLQCQLFGVCQSLELFTVSNRNILDHVDDIVNSITDKAIGPMDINIILPNIYLYYGYRDIVGAAKGGKKVSISETLDGVCQVIQKKLSLYPSASEAGEGNMKFDVIIGNPPYNNDVYIPFVLLGKKLVKPDGCMSFITPAKWQAKAGALNDVFRKQIVPYMSKIVYYKDSTDVFGIEEWGGISYFIVDKVQQTAKSVKVICDKNKSLQSDGFEKHIETELKLLPNKVIEIIDKCCVSGVLKIHMKQCEYTNQDERGHSKGEIPVMQSGNIVGYLDGAELKTVNGLEMWKISITRMIGAIGLLDNNGKTLGSAALAIIPNNCVPKGSFPGVAKFKTENECKSFVSFYNSKLISFLFYLGICGSAISNEFWRFVPDPGAFDHIFTDQELYTKYGLTADEVKLIESVIKARK